MSRRKIAMIVVAALVLLVLGVAYLRGHGEGEKGRQERDDKANEPVPVTVVPVRQKDVPVYLFAQGTVQARKTVNVRPQVGGLLVKVNFAEGQPVTAGQVLAEIDPRSYQATLDQALARQKQDQAQLATARSDLERSRELFKKAYISKQDLTKLENNVRQFEAAVAADAANVRAARLNLDYTKVRAPFDGLAGLRQVDAGNVVSTGDTLVMLTQVHPVTVLFSLPARHLEEVRGAQAGGQLPTAALDSADDHVLADDGHLEVIDNHIDSGSGTFRLKARFPNDSGSLWPGQFVNVRLRLGQIESGLVIPTQAVQRGPDGEYVYLLQDDNRVLMQPVVTRGGADPTHSVVREGLSAGDRVVTEGMFRLKSGSAVTPLAPGEVPAVAGSAAPPEPSS